VPESPRFLLISVLVLIAVVVALASRRIGANRRAAFLREVALILSAFFIYHIVRNITEGSVMYALAHAYDIADLERSLGFFVEPTWQATIVGEQWLVDLFNLIYIWGHWPYIGLVAIWLYVARPQTYSLFRNAVLVSGGIGLICFSVYPTAPPRLAALGFVDTVVDHSNFYHVLQPPLLTNQYAAFPSLHFGWNLLIGIALFREAKNPIFRALGVIVPTLMFLAIVMTANHYFLDALAGALIALVGLTVASQLRQWSTKREQEIPQPSVVV
jgi:hypothetical protein